MTRSHSRVWAQILMGAVLFFAAPTLQAADVIKIGVIGPMNFMQGKSQWNGALMAAEEINAEGGVKVGGRPYKIVLVKADTNEFLSIADATNAVERAVAYDQVDFLVGGFRTEAVLAMQDIAMDHRKIFIGCGAAHPELCRRVGADYGRYKYFFRGTPVNSRRLVETIFLNLAYVGAVLKKELNLSRPKVAVAAERQVWADPMIEAARKTLPRLGMEMVGVWRLSQVAKDVTAELSEIKRTDANLVFTIFSSSVGLTFARQAGQMRIPAAMVGVNVEAQKDGFWQASEGLANYVVTLNTYARDVVINETTQPFIKAYLKRYGEMPTYTADTYAAIKLILRPAVERAGALDPDKIVAELEKTDQPVPSGRVKFDAEHDLTWGPGYITGLGVQWQNGRLVAVWPRGWEGVTYEGTVPYKIAPWLAEKTRKR